MHITRKYSLIWISDVSILIFFFFQAEDGIRDYKVTGVQTCALPISSVIVPMYEKLPPEGLAARGDARACRPTCPHRPGKPGGNLVGGRASRTAGPSCCARQG